jgi:hypothetical protein
MGSVKPGMLNPSMISNGTFLFGSTVGTTYNVFLKENGGNIGLSLILRYHDPESGRLEPFLIPLSKGKYKFLALEASYPVGIDDYRGSNFDIEYNFVPKKGAANYIGRYTFRGKTGMSYSRDDDFEQDLALLLSLYPAISNSGIETTNLLNRREGDPGEY